MALRDFMLNNFKWKLIALILAITVWFIIQIAISKGIKPSDHPLSDLTTRTFSRRPVLVLKPPGDPGLYQISPALVEVTLRSGSGVLNKVSEDDIKVFVNLADMRGKLKENKQVFIYAPDSSEINEIRVEPPTVTVERVAQPK